MSTTLHEWLLRLVAVALMLAVAEAVTPQGLPRKVGRMVGGLLLMLVMLQPVNNLIGNDWGSSLFAYSEEALWSGELEAYETAQLEDIITDACRAYIEEQAQALGATVQVTVACQWQEESQAPVPEEVTVAGTWTEEQQAALTTVIETDFSIPAERQHYQLKEVEEETG